MGALAVYKGFLRQQGRPKNRVDARRAPQVGPMDDDAVEITLATFNIRGIMDRWTERQELLRQCIREIDADVYAFQEVLTGGFEQDRQLLGPGYVVHSCQAALHNLLQAGGIQRYVGQTILSLNQSLWVGQWMRQLPLVIEQYRERYRLQSTWLRNLRDVLMVPYFGNSLATRLGCQELSHDVLVLGDFRAAQRLLVRVPSAPASVASPAARGGAAEGQAAGSGFKVWVVNTHLDHEHADTRAAQATQVVRWMEAVKQQGDVVILSGDFNGGPQEPFHCLLDDLGFRSAHRSAHGAEPQGTWPSGIQAPFAEEGELECLDYVYIWEADGVMCRVSAAELRGTRPSPGDSTLYPSDHMALRVTFQLQRLTARDGQEAGELEASMGDGMADARVIFA